MNFLRKATLSRRTFLGTMLLVSLLAPAAAQTTSAGSKSGSISGGASANGPGGSMTGGMSSSGMSASPGGMPSTPGTGASPNGAAGHSGGMSATNTSSRSGSRKKAARPLKKIKTKHAPALPNQYTDYNWGRSSSYDATSLYAPTWNAPRADYTWGATPP